MFDHLSTYATDYELTKAFYEAVLPALGYDLQEEMEIPEGEGITRRACAFGPDGKPLFTPLVCISLMVFFVFALQCMSTIAVAWRETGGWQWPLFQLW